MIYLVLSLVIIGFLAFKFFTDFLLLRPRDIPTANKAVLVTGAGSGIGFATTKELIKENCFVYAADINLDNLKSYYSIKDENNGTSQIRLIRLDVTNQSQIDAAVEIVKQGGRGLYGIVNSAGIAPADYHILKGITECNVDKEVKPIMDINFLGTVRVNTAFSELIIESKGCIVNISSLASRVPLIGKSITYSASKAAINMYTLGLRSEMSEFGVRAVAVQPGFVDTPLNADMRKPRDWSGTRFKQTFQKIAKRAMTFLKPQNMFKPQVVVDVVLKCLFTSQVPSQVMVDKTTAVLLVGLLSSLPCSWQDYILSR